MKQESLPYQRRGSLQLWQFLLTLLDNPAHAHLIVWTGRNMEFKLIDPEEVRQKHTQRWEVVEYKYFVTVLKYIFLVSVLYSTNYFLHYLHDDFLL